MLTIRQQQQTLDVEAARANECLTKLSRPAPRASTRRLADTGDETGAGEANRDETGAGGADGGADETEGGADDSLDEAARNEGEYLRRRLRDELGREPTEAELNEWLRQHTEGY